MSQTEIIVCTTCRPAGVARDLPAHGQALFEAVQDALMLVSLDGDAHQGLRVRGTACMSGCTRACTVAFQAPGKHTYYFGDLTADAETAAQVVACAQLHRSSSDGNLARNARPERLRSGILARLPSLEMPA